MLLMKASTARRTPVMSNLKELITPAPKIAVIDHVGTVANKGVSFAIYDPTHVCDANRIVNECAADQIDTWSALWLLVWNRHRWHTTRPRECRVRVPRSTRTARWEQTLVRSPMNIESLAAFFAVEAANVVIH